MLTCALLSTLIVYFIRYKGGEGGYACYRIPNLLALPGGTILAFAEGRVGGCKPDVGRNRPIVVRASKDSGKTWGNITIAGPVEPSSVLRFLPVFQYLLEPIPGIWALAYGCYPPLIREKHTDFMVNTAHSVSASPQASTP